MKPIRMKDFLELKLIQETDLIVRNLLIIVKKIVDPDLLNINNVNAMNYNFNENV